ncbi:MAG: glutamine-hydrolyzing carbamoyl-phosphate synthase small subunit [Planctomycetes bacterium]|nr:glutamine-hydrolyzing carbamoyl-phosphate synthase small subunit [Planctomycetota bacterium]
MSLPARLVLEDGRVFHGRSFGAHADGGLETVAEVVFNTSHTGYQEVLTDPSYCGEAVTFAIPILGVYGVAGDLDAQSARPRAAAMICREVSRHASNYRSKETLPAYLTRHGIPGIEEIDTRTLTQHLRDHGSQLGALSNDATLTDQELAERARQAPRMEGQDLAKLVTTQAPYSWTTGFSSETAPWSDGLPEPVAEPGSAGRVVVVDFGVKYDILRHLVDHGCEVTVVPASSTLEEILAHDPQGIFLSNGPGDPAAVSYAVETVQRLVAAAPCPIYGICLGHQILCLALGAKTHHMKFGHRGSNHPVRQASSGRVLITAQNHGFAVDVASLSATPLEPSYTSLFDGCLEGVRHKSLPIESVQFHPEAGPGPHEAAEFFAQFAAAIQAAPSPSPQQAT